MNLTLKAQVSAGTSIEDALYDSLLLAEKLDCIIEFDFNGTTCFVRPGDNIAKGVKNYEKIVSSDRIHKFVNCL